MGSWEEASKSNQIRKASRKEKAKRVSGDYFNEKGSLQFGKNRKEMSMNLKKGTVFRSAVAAISLSMSSESKRRVLHAVETNAQLSKVLGMDGKGKEEEIISKLMELEERDIVKLKEREGNVN